MCTKPKGLKKLIEKILTNHTISPAKVATESEQIIGWKVSDATIRRRLKEVNIKTFVLRATIDITPTNPAKRLAFALEYIKKPIEFWSVYCGRMTLHFNTRARSVSTLCNYHEKN